MLVPSPTVLVTISNENGYHPDLWTAPERGERQP